MGLYGYNVGGAQNIGIFYAWFVGLYMGLQI